MKISTPPMTNWVLNPGLTGSAPHVLPRHQHVALLLPSATNDARCHTSDVGHVPGRPAEQWFPMLDSTDRL